jgi:hypothetical protein
LDLPLPKELKALAHLNLTDLRVRVKIRHNITKNLVIIMDIKKIDDSQISINGDRVVVSDLLAAIAATVGSEYWLEDLTLAHSQLSYRLSNQNFGEIGSEDYALEQDLSLLDKRRLGLEMEILAGDIAESLQAIDLKHSNGELKKRVDSALNI